MLKYLLIVILLKVMIARVSCAECPPKQLVYPCECSNDLIFCGHFQTQYLNNIFHTISKYLDKDNKSYLILDLNNISITSLDDNVFSGLQFKRIFLRNLRQLSRISVNAFNGTQNYTEELTVEGDNGLINDQNFKQFSSAINNLVNLETLYLDSYHLKAYPFGALQNQNLLDIDLNFNRVRNGTLKTLENFGFYYQNKLESLDITNQVLNFIPKNAFTFEKDSDHLLHVYLDNNQLNSSSFESGLFNNTNRVLEVYLRNNKIDYLDEKIFAPLLMANTENKIDVSDNPLVLDCRMSWMANNSDINLLHQILGGETVDGKHIIFLESIYFTNC